MNIAVRISKLAKYGMFS